MKPIKSILVLVLCLLTSNSYAKDFPFSPKGNWDDLFNQIIQFRAENPNYDKPVTVTLADGTYYLDKTLDLPDGISGTEQSPTIFRAAEGAQPVLSGGVRITDWTVQPNGRWTAKLPPDFPLFAYTPELANARYRSGEKDKTVTQLFVNGERRLRPKFPKNGYLFGIESDEKGPACRSSLDVEGKTPAETKALNSKNPKDIFRFRSFDGFPSIPEKMENLSEVNVHFILLWTTATLPIESINYQTEEIKLLPYPKKYMGGKDGEFQVGFSQWSPTTNTPYYFDNVKEMLGDPGSWYFDYPTETLTYVPMEGETPENTEVIVPKLLTILHAGQTGKMEWNSEAGKSLPKEGTNHTLSYVRFEGLTFAHSRRDCPQYGYSSEQGECDLPSALNFESVKNFILSGCALVHTGYNGLTFGQMSRDNRIEDCDLNDIGASGIQNYGENSTVIDTEVAYFGRNCPGGVGVMIFHNPNNTIQNCSIHDGYYSCISVGWTWGYSNPYPRKRNNVVAWNHCYNIGGEVMSDMGAVYTLGVQPGTRIEYNRIHDINANSYGGLRLYGDEGSSYILLQGNTVYRTKSNSYGLHYGKDNTVINNIFADSMVYTFGPGRWQNFNSVNAFRNIMVNRVNNLPGINNPNGGWHNSYEFDYNLYYKPNITEPLVFPSLTGDWQKDCSQDLNSLIQVDPQFVDWDNWDFRLKPTSPAITKLGFKPIPTDNTPGRRTKSRYTFKPVPAPFPSVKASFPQKYN